MSIYGNEMVLNMGIDPSQEIIYVIDMVSVCTFNLEPNLCMVKVFSKDTGIAYSTYLSLDEIYHLGTAAFSNMVYILGMIMSVGVL